jgi:hypothetical protein
LVENHAHGDAEDIRHRLLSRHSILRESPIISVDGRLGSGWLDRSIRKQAKRLLQPELAPTAGTIGIYQPAELRERLNRIDATPPRAFGRHTDIILMEVAPRCVHAYWHLADTELLAARRALGEEGRHAPILLRVHDVTGDALSAGGSFDVEVGSEEDHRYIDLWSPDRKYRVEVGLRGQDGRFIFLAGSNTVHVPRDTEADELAGRICVRENARAILRPDCPSFFRRPAARRIVRPGEPDWPRRDIASERQIRAWYGDFLRDGPRVLRMAEPLRRPDPAVLRREYESRRQSSAKDAPFAEAKPAETGRPDIFAVRLDAKAPRRSGRKPALPALRRSSRINLQELGREERARAVSRLTMLSAQKASGRLTNLTPRRLPGGAPQDVASRKMADDRVRSTRSVPINRLGNLIDELSRQDVDLEAELVLRGRVKPGKKVRIGGRIIETQPDGSFCVSCVVRDGKLHVPVEVVEAERVTSRRDISVDLGTPRRIDD